jgi:hypothetical protein
MIINDLDCLEIVDDPAKVSGGSYGYSYYESDSVTVDFKTTNSFNTNVVVNLNLTGYSASFGAKSQAIADTRYNYVSTKADGLAVVTPNGSFSAASGYAAIRPIR